MDQHKECFAAAVAKDINDLKKSIAVVRMPFAKQEFPGNKKHPLYDALKIHDVGLGIRSQDSFLFQIQEKSHDAGRLIRDVRKFFDALRHAAVLGRISISRP
jgi:hypothetical protein